MGALRQDLLVLDTNCLIYFLDDPDSKRGRWLAKHVFEPAVSGRLRLAISTISLAELLVGPFSVGQPDRAEAVHRALAALPGLSIVAPTADIAVSAARLRGTTGLRLPDALVVATAAHLGATLLTNDRGLRRDGLPAAILVLDDELSGD